jgi:FkbM family methyltransferase
MGVSNTAVQFLPRGLRARGRDWFETKFRGTPAAMLNYRGFQLSLDLDMVLSHYGLDRPQVHYLQVGAFDGVSGDPIYPLIDRHRLRGTLIEPQKDAFDRLRTNYIHFPDFRFVNAAIADRDGCKTLFRVKPGREPERLGQMASFDRSVLMRHSRWVSDLESMIEAEEVPCLTFETLFKRYAIEHVDLLQIDAEGLDAEILRLFNIPLRKPAIVHFEHRHLSVPDHEQSIGLLVDNGYRVAACGYDTLAYLFAGKSGENGKH